MKKKHLIMGVLLVFGIYAKSQTHGNNTVSNTTTSFGAGAGVNNIENTLYGFEAGANNTGDSNVIIGYLSGRENTSNFGTFVGRSSGRFNTTGEKNTFVGTYSGALNTIGKWNVALGHNAARTNTIGGQNTSVGVHAGYANVSGNENVSLGIFSGTTNTSGSKNTFLGTRAGMYNQGSNNVFLGYNAGANESTSNKLYIANTDTSSPLVFGDFSSNELVVNGALGIDTQSFVDSGDNMVYKLSVAGNVRAHGVKVYTDWADFVFEKGYNLMPLEEVEAYIKEHGHLKDIPSAEEVEENGIEVGEMNKLLLQKIEELTLYTIELKKEVEALKVKQDEDKDKK